MNIAKTKISVSVGGREIKLKFFFSNIRRLPLELLKVSSLLWKKFGADDNVFENHPRLLSVAVQTYRSSFPVELMKNLGFFSVI